VPRLLQSSLLEHASNHGNAFLVFLAWWTGPSWAYLFQSLLLVLRLVALPRAVFVGGCWASFSLEEVAGQSREKQNFFPRKMLQSGCKILAHSLRCTALRCACGPFVGHSLRGAALCCVMMHTV
jgi:hypothetical protein